MDLRRVDVFDDAELGRLHDVVEAAELHERPYATPWTLAEERALFRVRGPRRAARDLGGVGGPAHDGRGGLELPLLDNTDMTYVQVHVDPAHTGRGYGSALVDLVVHRTKDEGPQHDHHDHRVPLRAT